MVVFVNYDEFLFYFEFFELNICKGICVCIIGGFFEGVEGEFVCVCNDCCVVVIIEGVMVVVIIFVYFLLVEFVIEK